MLFPRFQSFPSVFYLYQTVFKISDFFLFCKRKERGCEKMIYIFSQPLSLYINFHGNWPNDITFSTSTSFRAMLHVVMDDDAFCSIEALSREISCHHDACAIRAWDFSTLWRSCLGHPNQPKLASKEALIKSLSAFILGFLCNARNGTTRIASYLRSPMTKQCIKILIKADAMN